MVLEKWEKKTAKLRSIYAIFVQNPTRIAFTVPKDTCTLSVASSWLEIFNRIWLFHKPVQKNEKKSHFWHSDASYHSMMPNWHLFV